MGGHLVQQFSCDALEKLESILYSRMEMDDVVILPFLGGLTRWLVRWKVIGLKNSHVFLKEHV